MDKWTLYTVARKRLAPLNKNQPLLPHCGNVYNNITFRYSINPTDKIITNLGIRQEINFRVFIGIISAPHNFKKRKWIRETWLRSLHSPGLNVAFVYGFFIGSSNDSLIETKVVEESRKYDDIIHLDVSETYRNLTLKTMAFLYWTQNYCDSSIDFVLKVDDDVYVNVYNLALVINSVSKESKAIYGFGWTTSQIPLRYAGISNKIKCEAIIKLADSLLLKTTSGLWIQKHGRGKIIPCT